MKIFAKSRTISLIVGLILLTLILPGAVSAAAGSPPVAQFTASATSGNAPLTIQFTDLTGSTGTTLYKWDMNNDGIIDYSTKDPAHTFTVAGTYTIKLTVINAYGNDSETKTNYITISPPGTKSTPVLTPEPTPTPQRMPEPTPPQVVPPAGAPKAQFISSTTQGQSPLSVTFTDQSTGAAPMTYRWDFSDGAGNLPENSQQNPTWRFWDNVATSYTVRLTVTNAYGSDTIVKQNYITLGTSGQPAATPAPTPQPTATPAPIPTATPTPAPTQTPNVAPKEAPKAQFISSTSQGQSPLSVQFTDQSTGAAPMTYRWDFSDGAGNLPENSQQNPTWRFWDNVATSYTVRLTVTNAYGSDTIVKQNYITLGTSGQPAATPAPTPQPTATPTPIPTATPTPAPTPIVVSGGEINAQFTASTTSGQVPLTVQFADQSVSTGTTVYKWDVNNDGVTDYTTKSPSHTYTTAGTYTVKLTVTNAGGSDSEIKTGYITATSSPVIVTGECFGAESCNPTGNPIGGGAGYTRIISETDSRVKYVVSTASQLITALKSAKSGEVVFIKGNAVIDMTSNPKVTIPAGVTVASDRGLNGSLGALIKRTKNVNGGWGEETFIVGGNNVRVTGLRLEGEMYPQDYGNKAGETYENQYLVGIYAKERTGFEVDNCELRGFAWAAVASDNCVQSYVHHSYIHHNQARGEGYGVALYGGSSIIEANTFDYNRHSITSTGYAGESYEARYNVVLGNGNPIGGHHFDVHQDERGGSFAGSLYKIHHNTFKDGNGKMASIAIRQRPTTGMYIDHNLFETISNATSGGVPIWERDSTQNMFATNNKWMGKLYTANSGIVWFA